MSARTPAEVHQRFAKALASNDLEALVDLYEPAAVLVSEPGRIIQGQEAIRKNLQELLATTPRLESETTAVVRAGEIAMLRARWSMIGIGPGGSAVHSSGESTEIAVHAPGEIVEPRMEMLIVLE